MVASLIQTANTNTRTHLLHCSLRLCVFNAVFVFVLYVRSSSERRCCWCCYSTQCLFVCSFLFVIVIWIHVLKAPRNDVALCNHQVLARYSNDSKLIFVKMPLFEMYLVSRSFIVQNLLMLMFFSIANAVRRLSLQTMWEQVRWLDIDSGMLFMIITVNNCIFRALCWSSRCNETNDRWFFSYHVKRLQINATKIF